MFLLMLLDVVRCETGELSPSNLPSGPQNQVTSDP